MLYIADCPKCGSETIIEIETGSMRDEHEGSIDITDIVHIGCGCELTQQHTDDLREEARAARERGTHE